MDIRTASFTKDYQFDLVSQDNGLFCLVAEFDNGVKFEVLLYVNDGEVYIAEYAYDTISDETILGYIEKPARIKEIAESYNRRIEAILEKLRGKRSCPVDSLEVKEIIGEYGFTMKQFSQSKDERGMMLSIAHSYREKLIKTKTDEKYGEGAAEFFAQQNF